MCGFESMMLRHQQAVQETTEVGWHGEGLSGILLSPVTCVCRCFNHRR